MLYRPVTFGLYLGFVSYYTQYLEVITLLPFGRAFGPRSLDLLLASGLTGYQP